MNTKHCPYCNKSRKLDKFATGKRSDNIHPVDMCTPCKWRRQRDKRLSGGVKEVKMETIDDVIRNSYVFQPGW